MADINFKSRQSRASVPTLPKMGIARDLAGQMNLARTPACRAMPLPKEFVMMFMIVQFYQQIGPINRLLKTGFSNILRAFYRLAEVEKRQISILVSIAQNSILI